MTILYPGSFNPFTKGHADILKRLLKIADKVIIGIGVNNEKKHSQDETDLNKAYIQDYVKKEGIGNKVDVVIYKGMTAELVKETGADCMARGVRNGTDFDYEYSLACANRDAFGIETILIPADPALSFVSSSVVRDLFANGREDVAKRFMP